MDAKPTNDSIPLREYVDLQFDTVRKQIGVLEKGIQTTAEAHNRSHEREHAMTEQAILKADEAMTIRLENMNQFREQLTLERTSYLTKDEFARFEEGYQQRHMAIGERVSRQENMWSKLQGQMVLFVAIPIILSLIATVVGIWQVLSK